MHIDIKYKKNFNIGPYRGGNIVYQIDQIWETKNIFILAYPQPLSGSKIYQNKTWQFTSKTQWKLQKYKIKVSILFRFKLYLKYLQLISSQFHLK